MFIMSYCLRENTYISMCSVWTTAESCCGVTTAGPVTARDLEVRRGSRVAKAVDQPASSVPSLGKLRGKALSGGTRSQTSIHSARSDRTGEAGLTV